MVEVGEQNRMINDLAHELLRSVALIALIIEIISRNAAVYTEFGGAMGSHGLTRYLHSPGALPKSYSDNVLRDAAVEEIPQLFIILDCLLASALVLHRC